MRAVLYNTELPLRTLWYDGVTAYHPDMLLTTPHQVKYITHMTDAVAEFNKYTPPSKRLVVKDACGPLVLDWNIPPRYQNMDVDATIMGELEHTTTTCSTSEFNGRAQRVLEELVEFRQRGLYGMLRTLFYIINTLSSNNVVWGVGRGSSVSSYVLYLIGTHDVDSYMYNLDIKDFLHD